jgi:CRP/FNR family transcriptional regulator, nitrogen fixation regulation protein
MLMRTQATSTNQGNLRHSPPAGVGQPTTLTGSMEMMGASMPFARNVEVYGEDEPAEYVYKVISGAVRTYKLLGDGRRQIGSFYLPGDIFGLEAGEQHRFTAEAVTDSTILVIKRSAVVSLARSDQELSHELWQWTAHELEHVQTQVLLLGRKNAQERVVAFLLEMAGRAPAATAVELPMCRQDIADYLGLTIETVSRTLTHLEQAAAISLPTARRIVLRNRAALDRLNG